MGYKEGSNPDFLMHYGVKGMKWGVVKEDDVSNSINNGRTKTIQEKSVQERNEDILRKNPNAAVINLKSNPPKKELTPDEKAARNKKIRNVAIGVGIGVTVAAGAVLYATHKQEVDQAVSSTLAKIKNTKVSDLSKVDSNVYKKYGLNAKTGQDAVLNNWVANWASCDVHRYDRITKEAYDAMDDNDLTLKAGQVFHRITSNSSEVLRDGAYASFEPDDVNRYRAFLPAMWKTNQPFNNKKIYSMAMEATEDIRSPSAKLRVTIVKELLESDSNFALVTGFKNSTLSSEEFALRQYNSIATGLCDRTSIASQKYLEAVKSRGYNALVDDNDAGRLAKTPMILLDVAKSIKLNSITPLKQTDLHEAAQLIKPMGSESIGSIEKMVKDSGINSNAYLQYIQRFIFNMT